MQTIILVRHGCTNGNKDGKLQGQLINDRLNSRGITQARAVSQKIAEEHAGLIYSSPLRRAAETAKIISNADHKLRVILMSELMERDLGDLSGMTWDQITRSGLKRLRKSDMLLMYDYRRFRGETHFDVRKRLRYFIQALLKEARRTKENIVVVTHEGVIRMLYDLAKLQAPEHIDNCSVNRLPIKKMPVSIIRTRVAGN